MTMLLIAIGLAAVVLIIAMPQLRRAALSLLGLLAIITIGSAVFAAAIWGIYQARPLITSDKPAVAQDAAPPEAASAAGSEKTAEADLAAAIAEEDEQAVEDAKQLEEEKKLHIDLLAARARVILEEDRKLAEQAASFPLPAGANERLGDIMAIRIPAWRDKNVALAQKEAIRAWLRSIGLTAEETASIVTAKAWGSLYDIWTSENSAAVPAGTQQKTSEPASASPQAESRTDQQADSEPEPQPESESSLFQEEMGQEPPPFIDEIPPRPQVARPRPRRFDAPRNPLPTRRPPPPQAPEVGPFGY